MIKIKGLMKTFDDHQVLRGVDMVMESGKIYGLVGSNGCGKTTIFKHIMSIYKGDEGEITYKDRLIDNQSYMKHIYYVQDDLFFPYNYTLNDLFEYEAMLYPQMNKEKFEALKRFFKVDENKQLRALSKGQKKQAAFIIAIAAMTETLLLDEIVDGLDAVVRKKFWKVIMSEVIDRELTVVISSHALTELDNICDKVGILHEGIIVKEDGIDLIKEETKRVQFAVSEAYETCVHNSYEVINHTQIGKVHYAVIKGDVQQFETDLYNTYDVLLFEVLNMNLEEIFISELGGLGYGTEEYETK